MAYPTLNKNEVYSLLFNQIIGIVAKSDNIRGSFSNFSDHCKGEGGLYGDTKLFLDYDVPHTREWAGDQEASNLLKINRAKDPQTQAITIDNFRVVTLTLDSLLSKRAFGTEGQFADFNSSLLTTLRDSKRVYDATTVNAYAGTTTGASNINEITVDVDNYPSLGQGLGQVIADLLGELNDPTKDYNDYKHLKSFADSDILILWNRSYVSQIKKIDLPPIFHNDELIEKFGTYSISPKYFGTINSGAMKGLANGTIRALEELSLTGTDGVTYELFAGDSIPAVCTAPANKSYTVDDDIICKVMHIDSIPYLSSFEIATSFFNPLAQATNNYLIWSHNTLNYLKKYPYITIKRKRA